MTTDLIQKLKDNIDINLLTEFDYLDFVKHNFIPMCIKNNYYYIATDDKKFTNENSQFIKSILGKDKNYKFISLTTGVLTQLTRWSKENVHNISAKTRNYIKKLKQAGINPAKTMLGELLIEAELITKEQLNECLILSKQVDLPLGSILVQKNYLSLDDLREFLTFQTGKAFVDIDNLKIKKEVINLLPEDFIRLHKVIPISIENKSLVLGMLNPYDKRALNEVVYLTGLKIIIRLMTSIEYNKLLETYFNRSAQETIDIIKTMEEETEFGDEETFSDLIEREIRDSTGSVAKFNTKILCDAIDMGASDIHIEPRFQGYAVRFRIAGILKEVLKLPPKVESAIITRYKVLAKMDIAEHRRPQDGTFSLKYKNISYDFRLNTLPANGREKMVIRVLVPAAAISSDDKQISLLGASEHDMNELQKIIASPNGIILASGPTGSGKTTTLYSILKNLNREEVNITTIEDPVEIKIERLNQSQINKKADITFASNMRAILRQDPDIIMVGEIRDTETLDVSISAALTGHLVLSTIHTNSAAATITRMIEMGMKSFLVASTLAGVVAQRLVRRLCPKCKEIYRPTMEDAKLVVADSSKYEEFTKQIIYTAKGCEECDFKGYDGRLGVYEILRITKEIRKMIALNSLELDIEEVAIKNGMKTLHESCYNHIINGETSISEFLRVLGPVDN